MKCFKLLLVSIYSSLCLVGCDAQSAKKEGSTNTESSVVEPAKISSDPDIAAAISAHRHMIFELRETGFDGDAVFRAEPDRPTAKGFKIMQSRSFGSTNDLLVIGHFIEYIRACSDINEVFLQLASDFRIANLQKCLSPNSPV